MLLWRGTLPGEKRRIWTIACKEKNRWCRQKTDPYILCLPPMTSDRLLGKAQNATECFLPAVHAVPRELWVAWLRVRERFILQNISLPFLNPVEGIKYSKIFRCTTTDISYFVNILEVKRVKENPQQQAAQMALIFSVKMETEVHWSLTWQGVKILIPSWSRGPWIRGESTSKRSFHAKQAWSVVWW